jgi:tetratricopeptide (TPR) repeat protein
MKSRKITRLVYTVLFLCFALISSRNNLLLAQKNPHVLYDEADDLLKQKQYAKALNLFEELLTLDPSYVSGYPGMVSCYRAMGDTQGAVIFVESLLLGDPENAAVNYGMGYSLFHLQKYDDAGKFFDKAISLNPNLAEAWNNRAVIYQFIDQDFDKARRYYQKAISLSQKTNNRRVLDIARKNLAALPKKEVLNPVTEVLTLEAFINRFIDAVDKNNVKQMKELVLGQRTNCEKAMQWLLENAMRANARRAKANEETAVLLGELLANLYEESYQSSLLKNQLRNYKSLADDKKKLLVKGESLLKDGGLDQESNRYSQALEKYRQALACFKEIHDNRRTGIAHTYLGDLHVQMRDWASARKAYQQSLSFFNTDEDMQRKAAVLSTLGKICYNLKEYTPALDFLSQSLVMYRKLGNKTALEQVEKNIELVKKKHARKS